MADEQEGKKRLTKQERENIEKVKQYQERILKVTEDRLKTELKLNKLNKETDIINKKSEKFIRDSYVLQSKINVLKKLEKDIKKEIKYIDDASINTNKKIIDSQTIQNDKIKESLEDKIKLLEVEQELENQINAITLGTRNLASEIQISSKETKQMFEEYGIGKDVISELSNKIKNNLELSKQQGTQSIEMKQQFSDVSQISEEILKNIKGQVYEIDTSKGKQIEILDISSKERDLQNIITGLYEERNNAIESGNVEQEKFVNTLLDATKNIQEMTLGLSDIQNNIKKSNESLEKTISITNKISSVTESFNKIQREIDFSNNKIIELSSNTEMASNIFEKIVTTLKITNRLTKNMVNDELVHVFSDINEITKDISKNLLNQVEEINKAQDGKIKIIDLVEQEYSLNRKRLILEKELQKAIDQNNIEQRTYIELQLESIQNADELVSFHKKMTKESEMHNKVLEKQESINKKISGVISGIMSKIPGGKFLNNVFKLDEVATGAKTSKEAFSDLKMEITLISRAIAGLSATVLAFAGVVAIALGGLVGYIYVLKKIIELVLDLDSKIGKVGKQFTISYGEARTLREEAQRIAKEMGLVGINTDQVIEGMAKVSEILNGINPVLFTSNMAFQALTKGATILSERFGISADEIQNIFKLSVTLNKPFNELVVRSVAIGKNIFTAKESLKVLSNISSGVAVTFKGSVDNLIMAEQKAKLLGTTLKDIRNIGTGLLDIETSLRQEMEARVLTGKELNLDIARYYAITGQFDKLQDEIFSVIGSLDEFKSMNLIQQMSLAQAVGMDVDQLSEFLTKAEQIQQLGVSQQRLTELQKMSAEQLNTELEKAKATGNKYYVDYIARLAKEKESLEVTERYNDILIKIKESLVDILAPIAEILNEEMKRLQNSGELKDIIENIRIAVKEIVTILPEVIRQLPNLINGFLAMANAAASIATNFDKILNIGKVLGIFFLAKGGLRMMKGGSGGGGTGPGGGTSGGVTSAGIGGYTSTLGKSSSEISSNIESEKQNFSKNIIVDKEKPNIDTETQNFSKNIIVDKEKQRRDKILYESYGKPYSTMYDTNSVDQYGLTEKFDKTQQTQEIKKNIELGGGFSIAGDWKERIAKQMEWEPGGFLYDSITALYDVGNTILSTLTSGMGEGVLYPKGGGLPEWMRDKNDPRYNNFGLDNTSEIMESIQNTQPLPYKYRFAESKTNLTGVSPLQTNTSIYPGIPNEDITTIDDIGRSIDKKIQSMNTDNNIRAQKSMVESVIMKPITYGVPVAEEPLSVTAEPQESNTFNMEKTMYTDKLLENTPKEANQQMGDIGKKLDTLINVLTAAVSQPTVIKMGERTVEEIKTQLNFRKIYSDTLDNRYGR